MFLHHSSNIFVENSTFADNRWGVNFNRIVNMGVKNSRFVVLSNNTGNPFYCTGRWANKGACGPISGCA